MKENDKTICQGFARLLILMLENDTEDVTLTFNFDKIKAKFKCCIG